MSAGGIKPFRTKYVDFVFVSGAGLALATAILWAGVRLLGLSPFVANNLGDAAAVTFVFFVSAHRSFTHSHRFMLAKFAAYVGWQVLHITLISATIAALVAWPTFTATFEPPVPSEVAAKLVITPITVTLNFLVASLLIERIYR